MKKLVKQHKVEFIVFGVMAAMMVITFLPQILSGLMFASGYDIRQQHYPFFVEFRNQWLNMITLGNFPYIFSGDLPFYSWNTFLGSNFIASKAYYTVGDIYNYLFLPLRNMHYFDIRYLQTVLKFSVTAVSSFLYLRKFYKKPTTLVVGTVAYTFSFWIVYFIGQPMFISFYSFMPLYFLGMESYLRDKKKLLFILMTTILICTSYYLFYTISIMSVVYYVYRYSCLKRDGKRFIQETLPLIGYYLVGVLMSAALIYPTAIYILENNRVGNFETNLIFPHIKNYIHMLHALISPSDVVIRSGVFMTDVYRYDEIPFWAGTMISLLLPQVLTDKDKLFRKATIVMYAFFLVMYIFPIGGAMLHGFSETNFRWLIFVIFMNILISLRYLENPESINIKNLKITGFVMVLLLLFLAPLTTLLVYQWSDVTGYLTVFACDFAYAVLAICGVMLLMKKPKWMKQGIVVISCISALLISTNYVTKLSELESRDYINRRTTGLQGEDKELIQFLRDNGENVDATYYRFFIEYETLYADYSYNSSIFYGINGLMTYDSTISPAIYDLEKFEGFKFYNQGWLVTLKDPGVVNFLSTEYAILTDVSKLPHDNFELIGDYYGIPVYRNLDVVHFGSTYSQVATYDELTERGENTTGKLAEFIIVNTQEEKQEIEKMLQSTIRVSLQNVQYSGNQLNADIETDANTFMIIQLPYDKGWSILVNGIEQKVYRANGGVMGVEVPEGESHVEMYFVPQGLKVGVIVSGIGILIFISIVGVDLYKRRKPHPKDEVRD
ncbi:MAG: YfhO family protein [Anaerorhabdus sp.]